MNSKIKLYGIETHVFLYLKSVIESIQSRFPNKFQISEVNDLEEIISDGIKSIPSISINGDVIAYNPQAGHSIEAFASKAIEQLYSESNFSEMKKIIVPTDFSDCSINAFRYAKSLAQTIDDSMIELVHIEESIPVTSGGSASETHHNEDEIRSKLKTLSAPLTNNIRNEVYNTPLKDTYIQGKVGDSLIDLSKNADLIIMGTEEAINNTSQIIGSIAQATIRKSKCPVLLIPSNYNHQTINKVAFAFTPSIITNEYLEKAILWAQNLHATLEIILFTNDTHSKDYKLAIQQFINLKYPDLDYSIRPITSNNIEEGLTQVVKNKEVNLLILANQANNIWHSPTKDQMSVDLISLLDRPILIINKGVKKCKCGGICKKQTKNQCDH